MIRNDMVEYIRIPGIVVPDVYKGVSDYEPLIPSGRWKIASWLSYENELFVEALNGGGLTWIHENDIKYGPKPKEEIFGDR